MKLTSTLLDKFVKRIRGNIWIGKRRFIPPVTCKDRLDAWKKMMYEEEVMMYLKNPYLSEDDEKLYLEKNPVPQQKVFDIPESPLKPLNQRTVVFHLGRLNRTRTWGDE